MKRLEKSGWVRMNDNFWRDPKSGTVFSTASANRIQKGREGKREVKRIRVGL